MMVDGLSLISKKPMMPNVINKGTMLGINDISTIFQLKNKKAIMIEMMISAENTLCKRFSTK